MKITEPMARCLKYLRDNEPDGVTLWPLGVTGVSYRMSKRCIARGFASLATFEFWDDFQRTKITAEGLAALNEYATHQKSSPERREKGRVACE